MTASAVNTDLYMTSLRLQRFLSPVTSDSVVTLLKMDD